MGALRLLLVEEHIGLARDDRPLRYLGHVTVVVLVPTVGVRVLAVSRVVTGVRRARMISDSIKIICTALGFRSGKGTEVQSRQRKVHLDV